MLELRTILASREPLYSRATATVDTAGVSIAEAFARLRQTVAPMLPVAATTTSRVRRAEC